MQDTQIQEAHQYFQHKLETILDEAKKATVFNEQNGVKTVILKDGTEVRYFENEAYHGPTVEDFITRIKFLCNVAKSVKDVEQIERIKEKFIQDARDTLVINRDGTNFDKVAEDAKKLIARLQAEVVGTIYPGKKYAEGVKELNKAAQRYQITHPRPIIVHVMPDGVIDAQFPKNPKVTYPGDYPRGKGVILNAVFEVMGHFNDEQKVDVDFVGSRAASYSTFDDSKQGELNNIENTRNDLIQTLEGLGINFRDKQQILINSVSLLSPLISGVTFLATRIKKGHVSERLQLAQQQRALEALNGQPLRITINNKPITVFPKINLINFNVKPKDEIEGREEIIDDEMIEKINDVGIKNYIDEQEKFLGVKTDRSQDFDKVITETRQRIHECKNPNEKKKLIHRLYFYDVLRQYYTGSYKDINGGAYFLAAQIIRTTEMAGIIPLWNCKTTKDRSGWEAVYIQVLLENELLGQPVTYNDQATDWFKKRINKTHEFSVSLEATGKNAPGARGNRVNDPTRFDTRKINSTMSGFAKIKHSKKSVIKHLAKASSEGLLTDEMINNLLHAISNDSLRKMIEKLKLIENNYIKSAMISCIDTKQLTIPQNIDEIIAKLNALFPKTAKPQAFVEHFDAFLAIVKDISWLQELQEPLFIDFIRTNKAPVLPRDQVVGHYIECVSKLIAFMSKIDIDRTKKLAKYLSKLQARQEELREIALRTPNKNKWAAKQTDSTLSMGVFKKTELEAIYVYDKYAKKPILVKLNDFVEEDNADKHVFYEYKNGIEYKPPGDEVDRKVVEAAVDLAIKKIKPTKLDDLNFNGKPALVKAAMEYAKTQLLDDKHFEVIKNTSRAPMVPVSA